MQNDNVKLKMGEEIKGHGGFTLILVIIAILIVAIIAFGFMNQKGQIEQSQEIKNQAVIDLEKINNNLKKNNQQIQNNLK